jgi:hypothetical protein
MPVDDGIRRIGCPHGQCLAVAGRSEERDKKKWLSALSFRLSAKG